MEGYAGTRVIESIVRHSILDRGFFVGIPAERNQSLPSFELGVLQVRR